MGIITLRKIFFSILMVFMLIIPASKLPLSPIEKITFENSFSLINWEIKNIFPKWIYLVKTFIQNDQPEPTETIKLLQKYLSLTKQKNLYKNRLDTEVLSIDQKKIIQNNLTSTINEMNKLKPVVEELSEKAMTETIKINGLKTKLNTIFPPVDISLEPPPLILVVSPRNTIQIEKTIFLSPDLLPAKKNSIENEILKKNNKSAYISNLSGLSTYPTLISNEYNSLDILSTTAHEWLHLYWFFKPFGKNIFKSNEMRTLNETAADIAGRELGLQTYMRLNSNSKSLIKSNPSNSNRYPQFTKHMRETRTEVEKLLLNNQIADAERYMQKRWWELSLAGYNIRKINQAYFALYGIYAESAGSISPIGKQLREFRDFFGTTGEFIEEIAQISSYTQFLKELERKKN
ncbi:MAG: hypothetical protein FI687_05030 [SAR202 cluster bacterium]|nr:hypothetical protein [SAR202 cluster bacterium]|tara:strand:- start:83461 stop:84672 length:1212 start_codon:yes stop_codon:yes gene_type:complete